MGTLICTIELDKQGGATVTIENPEAGITQTVRMDGTTLTLKVAGGSATSTYVQEQDKIHLTAKELVFEAETIRAHSTKQSSWRSEQTLGLESQGNFSIATAANLSAEATGDAQLSGANLRACARAAAALEGASTTLKGSAQLSVEGAQVQVQASGPAKIEAAMMEVKASGMLNLESTGVATLRGAITNVAGSLLNLG
jgi:hypothetical protein